MSLYQRCKLIAPTVRRWLAFTLCYYFMARFSELSVLPPSLFGVRGSDDRVLLTVRDENR